MSSKPENTFIQAVHKHLDRSVHREKMCNPYRSGTPDVWYSGAESDLWVEYKFIPRIPKNADIIVDLSPRQLEWITARRQEGRHVVVIVGSPKGGVVLENGDWERPISPASFIAQLLPRAELAGWISNKVGHGFHRSIV